MAGEACRPRHLRRRVEDLAADDFERLRATMAERWGPVRLCNAVTRTKSVFKFGFENGLLDRPVRYGSEFKQPDKTVLRRHKAAGGPKMLEADQIHNLGSTRCGTRSRRLPTARGTPWPWRP